MKKVPRQKVRPCSFDADHVANLLHSAVTTDLQSLSTEYMSPAHAYYKEQQCANLLKKYPSKASNQEALERQAFSSFVENTDRLRAFKLPDFPAKDVRNGTNLSIVDRQLATARNFIAWVLGPLDTDEWFSCCRHGPGTTLGTPYALSGVDTKYRFPATCTSRVKNLFDLYLKWDSHLKDAILADIGRVNLTTPPLYEIVPGSRTTTVPKDDTKRRTIAVEPTLNMFFQQGLMSVLYRRLSLAGLDLTIAQERHRTLAWEGSVCGSLVGTIDWSCASDSVLTELVGKLFPPDWFYCLDLVRSPLTEIDGVEYDLPMMGTMGNATTFPVETLIFLALAVAVHHCSTERFSLIPKWDQLKDRISVFGDDCILPTHLCGEFASLVESLGFSLNREKSFFDDPGQKEGFRESCGGDYYHGRNVRPFHMRAPHNEKLSSLEPWLYVIANGLLKKYISYFGSVSYLYDKALWREISSLFSQYDLCIKVVPDFFPDDAGLKIGDDFKRWYYPVKWSKIYKSSSRETFGRYSFHFCRFSYSRQSRTNLDVRFWFALKFPSQYWMERSSVDEREFVPDYVKDKRVGGYVVGKSLTSCWSLGVGG